MNDVDPHDSDHAKMIAEVATLEPQARAVLYIIEPNDDGSVSHILNSYGVDDDWTHILGLLASGQGYCVSEMFHGPEITSPAVSNGAAVDNDVQEEPEPDDAEPADVEAGASA